MIRDKMRKWMFSRFQNLETIQAQEQSEELGVWVYVRLIVQAFSKCLHNSRSCVQEKYKFILHRGNKSQLSKSATWLRNYDFVLLWID